jgi:hypothetical protein
MSKEKPGDDPRQRTDEKTSEQTDKPWNGPVEKDNGRTARPSPI